MSAVLSLAVLESMGAARVQAAVLVWLPVESTVPVMARVAVAPLLSVPTLQTPEAEA